MLFRAEAEFSIGSRVAWEDRDDTIDQHLDVVADELQEWLEVGSIEIVFDRERDVAFIAIVCHIPKSYEDPDATLRAVIGDAIRESGGMHENLLSLGDESRVKTNQNAWWGLRTLRWKTRTFSVEELPDEEI